MSPRLAQAAQPLPAAVGGEGDVRRGRAAVPQGVRHAGRAAEAGGVEAHRGQVGQRRAVGREKVRWRGMNLALKYPSVKLDFSEESSCG